MTVCTVLSLSEEEISLFLEFELAEETLSGVLLQETSKAQMQTIQIIFKSFILYTPSGQKENLKSVHLYRPENCGNATPKFDNSQKIHKNSPQNFLRAVFP